MELLLVAGFVLSGIVKVMCYPQGAPVSACTNLMPQHRGAQPRPGVSPYRFQLMARRYTPCNPGMTCMPIQLSITGLPFKGFIVQARSPTQPGRALGSFQVSGGMNSMNPRLPGAMMPGSMVTDQKLLQCPNSAQPGGTVTHVQNNDKLNVRLNWVPPYGYNGPIEFVGTVVQRFDQIYNVKSVPITGGGLGTGVMPMIGAFGSGYTTTASMLVLLGSLLFAFL